MDIGDWTSFAAGAAVGIAGALGVRRMGRRRAQESATAAAPPVEPPVAPDPTPLAVAERVESLGPLRQRVGAALEEVGERVSHARDFLDMDDFKTAVARLADPAETSLEAVLGYALGTNWGLACAAFEALIRRDDRAGACDRAIAGFITLPPGTAHFALRYFDSLDERPPAGAPAVFIKEWWINFPNACASFRESFARREALGDPPTFGDFLTRPKAVAPAVVEKFLAAVDHPYAKALEAEARRAAEARVDDEFLKGFGRFWPAEPDPLLVEPDGWRDALDRAEAGVLSDPARSVVVSGDPRSGKTSFLRLLGERLKAGGWRVFEAGAAELMSDQVYIGQLEGRVRQTVAELEAGKKVAWCVGDIALMAESGTHRGQAASLLDQILPAVNAGRLVILAETSREGMTRLVQARPSLRTQLAAIRLEPFDDASLDAFAQELGARLSEGQGPAVAPEAVETALQFSRQYFGSSPVPGVVADVLKRSAQQARAARIAEVGRSAVIAALAQVTGLPAAILDDTARVDLSEVRAFFSTRVIGQEEAVETVTARIAMLKAGLIDPNRPVGVFFFAGPTGTGKTELAKTLAEFLFGSPDRMARLDMSEFQTSESTVKILGERGRGETDSLVSRIRKQPFSVILLDEFEKAHPNVWDLFLQVFDDGRLTDANGYEVDFRHTLIILTSNLGAVSHRSSGLGFTPSRDAYGEEQVLKAVSQAFRPEFVNRLDKVVVFKPLSRELMGAILRKELAQVLERRGLRNRDWAVEWEPSALDFLLDRGFSPEMGARPLKRAIDQHLLAPLAATLVEHRFPEGGQFLFVRSNGQALEVEFVDPNGEPALAAVGPGPAGSLAEMILQPRGSADERAMLEAGVEALEQTFESDPWLELKARLEREASAPDIWEQADRHQVFARLERVDRVQEAARTARRLDGRLGRGRSQAPSREMICRLALQLHLLQAGVEDVLEDAPVEALIRVEPALDSGAGAEAAAAWAERLAAMYRLWAERRRMPFDLVEPRAGSAGRTILRVSGFGAFRTLARETGLHVLEEGPVRSIRRTVARVRVAAGPMEDPPTERLWTGLSELLDRAEADAAAVARRYRDGQAPLVRDARGGWRSGRVEAVLGGDFDLMGLLAQEAA